MTTAPKQPEAGVAGECESTRRVLNIVSLHDLENLPQYHIKKGASA